MLELITSLLLSNASPQAVPADVLAPEILRVAQKRQVSAIMLTRIILVESRGVANAKNDETEDYGLLQINERTRSSYGFTRACLKDWKCNLDAGAQILSDLLMMDGGRVCAYNLGPKGRFKKYREHCLNYERKIARFN